MQIAELRLIENYTSGGLTALMANIAAHLSALQWSISSFGYRLDFKNGGCIGYGPTEDGYTEVSRFFAAGKALYFIPINIKSYQIGLFSLQLNSDELSDSDLASIQSLLSTFASAEALQPFRYQSLMPLVFPFGSDLNQNLLERRDFFFLNGAPGSGKHTFARSYSLLHHLDFSKVIEYSELAEISKVDQSALLGKVGGGETIFVYSKYSFEALLEYDILDMKLAGLCQDNMMRMQFLKKKKDFDEMLPYFRSFKLMNISPPAQWPQKFSGGFTGFVEYLQNLTDLVDVSTDAKYSVYNLDEVLAEGRGLRGLIAGLEKRAIRLAFERVGGSQNKIADYLGISRGSLQHKIKKHKLPYSEWS